MIFRCRVVFFKIFASISWSLIRLCAFLFYREKCAEFKILAANEIFANRQLVISEEVLVVLMAAEDHRFFFHRGVDPYAIIRAIVKTVGGNVQGASTIEQQFVRTLTKNRARTLSRKLREIFLAASIWGVFSKEQIVMAYLGAAYFGEKVSGIVAAMEIIDNSDLSSDFYTEFLISHLKYPLSFSMDRFNRERRFRASHIKIRQSAIHQWLHESERRKISSKADT